MSNLLHHMQRRRCDSVITQTETKTNQYQQQQVRRASMVRRASVR